MRDCGRSILGLKLISLERKSHFHLLQFAIVLLQDVGRFQQLIERFLVENWLGFIFGHDFFFHPGNRPIAARPFAGML
jgi:hypothetical protein